MGMDFDTIAAISTPPGEGGIGIVRISGDEAIEIADKLYSMGKKSLADQDTHTIHYGKIVNPKTGDIVDEVMVSVMRAPKTYTREDVVEINSHGGILVVNKVLQVVLNNGARLAEPGEFTKRAFLNGRIDLSQAEAVMDMIRAKTDRAMHVAVDQLDGQMARLIRDLRQKILDTLAQVEVNIDYPEYDDVEEMTSQLLEEEYVNVKGVPLKLIDTAGIRETDDEVERIGVDRSRQAIQQADLILLVFNQSEKLTAEDEALIEATKGQNRIILLNKTDLDQQLNVDKLSQLIANDPIVSTSMMTQAGMDELQDKIAELFFSGQTGERDATYVSNTRHIALLEEAEDALSEVLNGIALDMPVDLVQIDMRRAWDLLGEITGDSVQDELITKLFSQFCLGK